MESIRLNDAQRFCEITVKEHAKLIYEASHSFDVHRRHALFAVVTFHHLLRNTLRLPEHAKHLEQFKNELQHFMEYKLDDVLRSSKHAALWIALNEAFMLFELDYRSFLDHIEGQERILNIHQPQTQHEVNRYCYYTLGTLIQLVLPIISDTSFSKPLPKIQSHPNILSEAIVRTKILRDVGKDITTRHRVYLPKDLLDTFEIPYISDTLEYTPHYIHACSVLAIEAHQRYTKIRKEIALYRKEARLPMLLICNYYEALLFKLEAEDFPNFSTYITISEKEKKRILARSSLQYRFSFLRI